MSIKSSLKRQLSNFKPKPKADRPVPVGAHRFKPMERRRQRLIDEAQSRAREIYSKAFPERQEYPPQLYRGAKEYKSEHLSYLRLSSQECGAYFIGEHSPKAIIRWRERRYQVQQDGSLKRVYEAEQVKKAA